MVRPLKKTFFMCVFPREAAKKNLYLMAGPLKKKIFFFNLFFQRSNFLTAIKLEGGGGGLNVLLVAAVMYRSAYLLVAVAL